MDTSTSRPAAQLPFVATITLVMVVAVLLQVVFGALGPFLTQDLGLSRTQLGSLTTALYVTGAFLSPAAGRVVDALGGRPPLLGLFVLKAAGLVVVAWAPTYGWLLAGALLGGLAVATGNPLTNRLIQAHTPPTRQGLVTGIKQSGVQIAIFVGGALLPLVAAAAGWRVAVLACLVLPVVGLLGSAVAVPATPPQRSDGSGAAPSLMPGTGWLTAYAVGIGIGISSVGAYLPLFGVEELGIRPALAGWLTATLGGVAVVARIGWGSAGDRVVTPPQRTLRTLGALAVLSAGLVLSSQTVGAWAAWLGAAVMGASAAAWNAVGMLAIVRGADRSVAGRVSGLVLLSFYGGFVVGPVAFGALVDATDSYAAGWGLVLAAYTTSTVVAMAWLRVGRVPT